MKHAILALKKELNSIDLNLDSAEIRKQNGLSMNTNEFNYLDVLNQRSQVQKAIDMLEAIKE